MIIETLAFCHYASVFGLLLGVFQYLPTILYFGSWFWSLYRRDSFFVGLATTMNIMWLLAVGFKFLLIPIFMTMPPPVNIACGSFLPSALGTVIGAIFTPNTLISINGTQLLQSVDFPHIDVMETGIYNGYVLTFIVVWGYSLQDMSWASIFGLLAISLVPWSFISAGVTSSVVIGMSFLFGLSVGTCALFIVYAIVDRSMTENQGKKLHTCFYFWCGDPSPPTSLFYKRSETS